MASATAMTTEESLDTWLAFAVSYVGLNFVSTTVATFINSKWGKSLWFGKWMVAAQRPRDLASCTPEQLAPLHRVPAYAISTIHALVTSLWSLYLIAQYGMVTFSSAGVIATPDGTGSGIIPAILGRRVLAFSSAYFLHDLISSQPDWIDHPADLIHHILGLTLTMSCLVASNNARIGHHLLVTEASTAFINARWALFTLGHASSGAYTFASLGFAAVFFVTRILYLPWATIVLMFNIYEHLPYWWTAYFSLALCLLNMFWFYKIVSVLLVMAGIVKLPEGHAPAADPHAARPAAAAAPAGEDAGSAGTGAGEATTGTDDEDESAPLTGGAGANTPAPASAAKASAAQASPSSTSSEAKPRKRGSL